MKTGHLGCAALALALCPRLAHAHLISTGLGPAYDGITHFALTPEFVLPVVGTAVLAGLRDKAHARLAIFALPLAWLIGGIAEGFARFAVPDSLAWLPLLLVGCLVAADLRLSATAVTAVAGGVGLALGCMSAGAMVQAGVGLRAVLGSGAAVFVVTTLAAAAAISWQSGWLRIAWRVAGSWIAAGGLLLLGWSLR